MMYECKCMNCEETYRYDDQASPDWVASFCSRDCRDTFVSKHKHKVAQNG